MGIFAAYEQKFQQIRSLHRKFSYSPIVVASHINDFNCKFYFILRDALFYCSVLNLKYTIFLILLINGKVRILFFYISKLQYWIYQTKITKLQAMLGYVTSVTNNC